MKERDSEKDILRLYFVIFAFIIVTFFVLMVKILKTLDNTSYQKTYLPHDKRVNLPSSGKEEKKEVVDEYKRIMQRSKEDHDIFLRQSKTKVEPAP
jgi:hypothetical protein